MFGSQAILLKTEKKSFMLIGFPTSKTVVFALLVQFETLPFCLRLRNVSEGLIGTRRFIKMFLYLISANFTIGCLVTEHVSSQIVSKRKNLDHQEIATLKPNLNL